MDSRASTDTLIHSKDIKTPRANTQNITSAKMECEGNLRQQQMKLREVSSSGLQVVNGNPSMQAVKVLKMKSLEISPRKSLEGNGDTQNSAGAKKYQSKFDEFNQGFRAKKKNSMCGALSLLLDAIQLLEDEDQIKEGKEKAKGLLARPDLDSYQCRADDDSKATQKKTPNQDSHRGDCQNNSKGNTNDTGHEAKHEVQTKRRRRKALPSKYSDSVLLPWK